MWYCGECVFSYCKCCVCSHTSSCFPVPFDLWDNWLEQLAALRDRREATASDVSAPSENNREVNHCCLFYHPGNLPGVLLIVNLNFAMSYQAKAPSGCFFSSECKQEGCEWACCNLTLWCEQKMEKWSKSQLFICISPHCLYGPLARDVHVCVCVCRRLPTVPHTLQLFASADLRENESPLCYYTLLELL